MRATVSMNLNSVEYYYIRNAQGDIIGLFDKTGAQVVTYTYDTWGKLISTTDTLASTVGIKKEGIGMIPRLDFTIYRVSIIVLNGVSLLIVITSVEKLKICFLLMYSHTARTILLICVTLMDIGLRKIHWRL